MPSIYRPQLARLVKAPPDGDDWLHEMKYDGYRIGCVIADRTVTLLSRNGRDGTAAFPEIARAALHLGVTETLIDGEVAIVLPDGRTSFQALHHGVREGRAGAEDSDRLPAQQPDEYVGRGVLDTGA